MFCRRAVLMIPLFFLFSSFQHSFSQSSSVVENRLCRTWTLAKIIHGEKTTQADQSLNQFVLMIDPNHTVKQGMMPDGLISGKWTFDEAAMMFIITDDLTGAKYPMKVLSITQDELVLNDTSSQPALYLHYKPK